MTVHELCDRMSNREFIAWTSYFGRQWQRQELEAKKARNKGR